ncbi:hypothetical protein QTH91_17395 [Variovorax dokdonensis]|uniref:Uncharacterized protein n=1 Tax=Variovorax dokdonensis TaxID=344883 RepID=A0ABT7NE96_9BURK|nr:hypothetical protein [Variovorax dokdonensis]MDM0046271.1 hypothetical protein [Variovorax dokdonensis]
MKRTLIALGTLALVSTAFAQQHVHNPEAAPDHDTKPQVAADSKAQAKQPGVTKIKDGSTARGQGSGVAKASKAEEHGQSHADAREAKPHTVPEQGGTPK